MERKKEIDVVIWELGYESRCRDETLNEHLLGCVEIVVEGALSRKKMGKDREEGGAKRNEEKDEKHRGAKRRREGSPTQCGQRDENQAIKDQLFNVPYIFLYRSINF